MPDLPFAGRNALVTGGAVRLGRAIALRLATEGANVCIHYRGSEDAARQVVEEIRSLGRESWAMSADFSGDAAGAARQLFSAAMTQDVGRVDLLVNSAAIFEPGSLLSTTSEAWDRHLEINLKAPVWLAREFAAQLPEGCRGGIVNIVDWRALRPLPGHLAYTVAKAGLVAATQLLAQELGPRIQVNAVAPGAILPAPGSDPEQFAGLGQRNPLGKTGIPDDVTDAVVYLLRSRFVTGEILTVTGGEQL